MYDDYDVFEDFDDFDELDEFADDDFFDSLEGHEVALDDLAAEEAALRDGYKMKLQEIDEYWNRENQYIKTSGIYSEEEIQSILENHQRIRREKKAETRDDYEAEKDFLRFERDNFGK